ncbi:MAG: hypothetical protein LUG86_08365 [Oscillospiraceae bacterium]|nr:hypothetical protein [Oscillospiraceae bacterium]
MSCEVDFVKAIFKAFEKDNIKFCVLRNADEVEYGDAHDIDMTADADRLVDVENIMLRVAGECGWKIHIKTGSSKDKINIKCYHFYFADENLKEIHIAHFDVFPTFAWNGYVLLENASFIDNIDSSSVIHKADPAVEAVTKLFIRLLHNGYIKSKYKEYISDVFSSHEKSVKTLMENFLDADTVKFVYQGVMNSEWTKIEEQRDRIVKSIQKSARKSKISYYKYLLKKAKDKPGLMVAFEGTDGSGKSTIIDGLEQVLENSFPKGMFDYNHWRPGVIVKKKGGASGESIVVTEPHAKKPYGRIKSFLKFMLFNFDYLFGYWLKVRKQLSKGHLVVFDRYYYDYYMDKIRYRLSISDKVLDFFKFMIPKPDVTFLLIGDPQVLYERKKEIDVSEIEEQIQRLRANEHKFAHAVEIDVNESIDDVVYNVAKEILNSCDAKC